MFISQLLFPTDSPPVSPPPTSQCSSAARSTSCVSTIPKQHIADSTEAEDAEEAAAMGRSTNRRIRAPKGEGLSSLMAALTSSKSVTSTSEVHSLPRLATNSSLNSESSCSSVSYRTLSASSTCCQVGTRGAATAYIKTFCLFYVLICFLLSFADRIPKLSPATFTLYYPLTPLPESFHSLHPRLPLLPSLSPTPSLAAQVTPQSLSGPPSIPIKTALPLTTSPLPPSLTQSLSLAATLRMTRVTAPLALGSSTAAVAPRTARARGATGLSRQVAASTATKQGVTGLASAVTWGAMLVKAGTVIRCCPLATPRTLCVQRNVAARHQ